MNELAPLKKLKLGELLVEHEIISRDQLDTALQAQAESGQKLGHVLIALNYIDENRLLLFLSKQLHIPFLELAHYHVKPEVVRELPEPMARRYKMIPINRIKNKFLVAVCDPTDLLGYDEISRKLKKPMMLVLVRERDMELVLNDIYRKTDEIASLVGVIEQEMRAHQPLDIEDQMGDAPIKKLLDSIFEDAVQMNASDIHIEPSQTGLRIRQRVDGILEEQVINGKNIVSALILRLKLIAKLDISERRLPQDGRFTVTARNKQIDVRMSTLPLQESESAVLRLLYQDNNNFRIENLGFSNKMLARYLEVLAKPQGMILVTGPTGSGKTSTLYASLMALNSPGRKIITLEDPIEYSFERINQIQIHPKIGLDFPNALRSILRNDPDIIMVGEIRDEDTAQMALRSAITGHLVFSTLHTSDALAAPLRLMDMGVQPYLTATAIQLILAQRLLRRNCTNCSEQMAPSDLEKKWLEGVAPGVENQIFVRSKGCSQCQQRGYKGRVAIFEFLEMDSEMASALRKRDIATYYNTARSQGLYQPILKNALQYAIEGIISIQEVMKLGVN